MKILILSNKVPWPPDDGGRIAMLNMAKGFVENDCEVFILSMSTDKHSTRLRDIPDELTSKIKFNIVNVPAKVSTIGVAMNFFFSKLPYTASRFISPDFNEALINLLQNNDFDIVQLEGLYLLSYLHIIRKHSKARVSLRAHNIEHEIWLRTAVNEKSYLRRLYAKNLVARIRRYKFEYLNKYDFLIPITKKDGEAYTKLGNILPTYVSQTGVNMSDYESVVIEDVSPSIFHLGALDWSPNQEGLIWFIDNVWLNLHSESPKLQFFIAGRNAPEWLEEKFRNTDGIVYKGEVYDAIKFMESMQIMIVPLLSGSGMRIKVIEGLALGKCIVSTSIGAEGIDVKDGENIIIADTPDEFNSKINSVISNLSFQKSISENAIKFIKDNFDNNKLCGNLLEFYREELNTGDAD